MTSGSTARFHCSTSCSSATSCAATGGESIKNHQPAFTLILERVPDTLEPGLAAFMLAAEEGWTRRGCTRSTGSGLCRAGADVHTLTLWAKQAEQFDALRVRAVEPVRDARIELGGFAGAQHQIVL